MRLKPCGVAAILRSLGETEASPAGEQLAKGYPSRAVTDLRRGRPPGLPAPYPVCAPTLSMKGIPRSSIHFSRIHPDR